MTEIVHKENCPILAQLALGAYYKDSEEIEPTDMTKEEIKDVVNMFIRAAERAKKANYDGVQIQELISFF